MARIIIHNYVPMTKPDTINVQDVDGEEVLFINGKEVVIEITHLCGTKKYRKVCLEATELPDVMAALQQVLDNDKYALLVRKFEYNGFCGRVGSELAKYAARFLSWSNDPGVAKCECSDGISRLIPTFALSEHVTLFLPEQIYSKTGPSLFGEASNSE